MKNKVSILGILLLLGCSAGCAFAYENVEVLEPVQEQTISTDKVKPNKETFEKIQKFMDEKDFNSAISYLNGYIASKPKKYEAYKLRGDAYYALRRYSLAQVDYQKAIDIKTDEDKLLTNTKYLSAVILGADRNEQLQNAELGELYGRLMYAQKAQNNPAYASSYESAIKYNSHIYLPKPKKSDWALINCPQKYSRPLTLQGIDVEIYSGIEDISKENFNEAVYKLQKVVSEYPDYYLGHYLLGVAFAGLENYDDAQGYFEKSISLNPYDFESYASLGQIHFDKAETQFSSEYALKSNEYFKKALSLNPNCYLYYFYMGLNNLQMGNVDLAIKDFNKAISLNSNDYNSIYYKLIALFNKGDYTQVINTSTTLLYKHVSNSNSVLYLRALAYYKSGDENKALLDLENIQNNIEDIYNADIKVVSARDKALESYLYYLKSEIAHNHGYGAASDMDRAYANPIISQIAKVKRAVKPYEKYLNADEITLENYNKYAAFYEISLPKMLNTGIVITQEDVDNQYDYLRTTFGDLGISFAYVNPNYKLAVIDGYPYKKYAKKLSFKDFALVREKVSADIRDTVELVSQPELKSATSYSEIIGDEAKPSLAQLLASNELVNLAKEAKNALPSKEDLTPKDEVSDAQKVQSSNIADGETHLLPEDKNLLNDKNNQKVKEILEEEKVIEENVEKESSAKQEVVAVKDNAAVKPTEMRNITEKYADVSQINVEQPKPQPEISDKDEVVLLQTNVSSQNSKTQTQTQTDNFTFKAGKTDFDKKFFETDLTKKQPVLEEKSAETKEENATVEKEIIAPEKEETSATVKEGTVAAKEEIAPQEVMPQKVDEQKAVELETSEEAATQEVEAQEPAEQEVVEQEAVELDEPAQDNITQKNTPPVAVPVVVVPEINVSDTTLQQTQTSAELVEKVLDPAVEDESAVTEKSAEAEEYAHEEFAELDEKLSQELTVLEDKKSQKARQAAERKAQAEQLKADRLQAKVQAKEEKVRQAAERKAQAEQLKADRLQAKVQAKEEKARQTAERKAQAEQLKAERVQAKVQTKEEKARQVAERKAQAEQLKADRLQAKVQAKEEKARQTAERKAQAEQLKADRLQAKVQAKEEKARQAAERKALKEQVAQEAKEIGEVNAAQKTEKHKFSLKNFFSKSKKKQKVEAHEVKRTVIKSLSQ